MIGSMIFITWTTVENKYTYDRIVKSLIESEKYPNG